jgi:serine/threonine protein kinase
MIGRIISHYEILELLGEGGMGVVYRAEDAKLKRLVALKFLSSRAVAGKEERARLMHEARAAAALNHPNICTIFDVDRHENQPFIAMEYIEGTNLKTRIHSGPLSYEDAVTIAAEIAEGLEEAHKKGIIHRDIKSSNIMLTPGGRVKVMDFGLAKSSDRTQLTQSGTTIGTVAYMSPEQGRGEAVDHRTDIWSLGIVLYEMVTGRLPFQAEYEQATLYLIINEEPSPATSLRPDVPGELERIIEKTLVKNIEDRYGSAKELKEDLRSFKDAQRPDAPYIQTIAKQGKPSIAVLPFRDMSSQRDQEYFCEGIAEELINALVKLEDLRVAARTSAFQFKDRDSDMRKIGEQLEVQTILEGSIRKAGNRLRITAQLISVEDGFHIWSEKYDRELDDIFAIQDEISLAIVDKLKVQLLGNESKQLVKRHTRDQEAHNLYLKGLYFWNRRLEGGMKMAMEYFHRAIEKDPGYALAHVGVADTYNIAGLFGYSHPGEVFPKAKASAINALKIDDSFGEAHASLAFAKAFYDWNWVAAEKEFKRAIELNPDYASAREWYALHLWSMGRFDEAIAEAELARDIDPLSIIINTVVGIAYYFARRYKESIAQHKKALEMDPNFLLASTYIVLPYMELGMYNEMIEIIRKAEPLAAEHTYSLGYFGNAYGRAGRREDALRILGRMDELARTRYVSAQHRAILLVGLGDLDEALDYMEQAYVDRCPVHTFSNTAPNFDCLQSNTRFRSLMKEIGF